MSYSKTEVGILCDEIKKKYSIVDYVRAKGIELHDRGTRYFIICPFHGDGDPSLSIEKHGDIELFHCFGCKKSGSIIDFYAEYERVSVGEAIKILGEGIDFDFDISSLLEEFDEDDKKTSILEMNIAISIHCFEYLSVVKSEFTEDISNSEFKKIDSFYKMIDNLILDGNEEKIYSFYIEICFGDFLVEQMKKLRSKK